MITLSARVAGGNAFVGTHFKVTQNINMNVVAGNEEMLLAGTGLGRNTGTVGQAPAAGTNNFQQIGYRGRQFRGNFDGDNKTISNLRINRTATSGDLHETLALVGLLGDGGVVRNVILENVDISGMYRYNAGVVGIASGASVVDNCKVNTGSIRAPLSSGGIVGIADGTAVVRNCETGTGLTINVWGDRVGGIVGHNSTASAAIDNCVNNAAIVIHGNYSNIGGVVGLNNGIIRNNTTNRGNITTVGTIVAGTASGGYIGGIVGQATTPITSVANHGNITVTGTGIYVGGVAGYTAGAATLTTATNHGVVNAPQKNYVGGVTGVNVGPVTGGLNKGAITGQQFVGGVSGYASAASAVVTRSENRANVTGLTEVGGVIGRIQANATFSYLGSARGVTITGLTGGNSLGGIVGRFGGGMQATLQQSYSFSNVVATGTHVGTGGIIGTINGSSAGTSQRPKVYNTFHALGNVHGVTRVGGAVGQGDYPFSDWQRVAAFSPNISGSGGRFYGGNLTAGTIYYANPLYLNSVVNGTITGNTASNGYAPVPATPSTWNTLALWQTNLGLVAGQWVMSTETGLAGFPVPINMPEQK